MGYLPDTLIGPAFNVSVMLAETENASSERNSEVVLALEGISNNLSTTDLLSNRILSLGLTLT